MTKRKVEQLVPWATIEKVDGIWRAFKDGEPYAEAPKYRDSDALRVLSERCFHRMCVEEVFPRDGWRCIIDGRGGPVQGHHKVKRSHGGRHVPENIVTVCPKCHEDLEMNRIKLAA